MSSPVGGGAADVMMDSALDVYKSIAAGTAQINPFSDYFQETEDNMKSNKPVFEGRGISREIHFQMPYECKEGSGDDQGCSAKFRSDETDMVNYMEAEGVPSGYTYDKYDYSKGVFFDYSIKNAKKVKDFMEACDPYTDKSAEACLERVFECGAVPWEKCSEGISYCSNHVPGTEAVKLCKYDLNNKLIKEYLKPTQEYTQTRPFCRIGETPQDCVLRYECGPEESNLSCSNLSTCSDDSDFTCKYTRTGEFVKRFFNPPTVAEAAASPSPVPSQSADEVDTKTAFDRWG